MEGSLSTRGDSTESVDLKEGTILPLEECLWEKADMMDSASNDIAFFLVDLGEIYRKLEDWRRLLPRVEPFYALKCNNHPVVARFLAEAGVGFDCASKIEIEQILNLGVHPSRIIYANPCKQNIYIRFAASNNVDLMTFDDVLELVKIKKHFPSARLLLRIQSNETYKAKYCFNNKFGCHVINSGTLLAQAWTMKMNIVGVSFHVGSLPEDVDCYSSAIADAYTVFTTGQDMGFKMEILDIGGGFPGKDEGDITFKKAAEAINKSLDQFFPASRGVEIIAEPGRYLVTTAFTLAVNIIAKRVVSGQHTEKLSKTETQNGTSLSPLMPLISSGDQNDDDDKNHNNSNGICVTADGRTNDDSRLYMYYVSDGIYGAFANVVAEKFKLQVEVLHRLTQAKLMTSDKNSIIWGPSCDSVDCVVPHCRLPELEVGQWLYFCNMGAYSLSLASNFNGIERPLVFPVCSKDYWNKVYPVRRCECVTPALHHNSKSSGENNRSDKSSLVL